MDFRLILLVLGVLLIALLPLLLKVPARRGGVSLRVEPVPAFFTRAELSFQHAISEATIGLPLVVCPKVRVLDVAQPARGDAYLSTFNKLQGMHLDWLIVSTPDMRPLAAIELDGASHGRDRQRRADSNKTEALAQIGLPLWRFTNDAIPDSAHLRQRLDALANPVGGAKAGMTEPPAKKAPANSPRLGR